MEAKKSLSSFSRGPLSKSVPWFFCSSIYSLAFNKIVAERPLVFVKGTKSFMHVLLSGVEKPKTKFPS